MPHKKLITLSDEQKQFIEENELRVNVKASDFIDTAISYYITHLKEVRIAVEERRRAQLDKLFNSQTDLNNK